MGISISARIRYAMLGLSTVLCVLFAALIFMLVYIVEDRVFTNQIQKERRAYHDSGFAPNWYPQNAHIKKIDSSAELPTYFPQNFVKRISRLSGIHEYFDHDKAIFVAHYRVEAAGTSYFLLYDVSDFLAVRGTKSTLFILITVIALVIIVIAVFLAQWLTKTTLAPVRRLSRELQTREIDDMVIELAHQFSQDEIGILAQELALALERARDAAKREYEFNRGVSHELRTPIQAAQSATELLMMSNKQNDAKQQKYIERLSRAITEMNQVVEAFLWLSKDHNRRPSDVCSIYAIGTAIQEYQPISIVYDKEISEHSVYQLPENVLVIVMRSLIKNAVTYSTIDSIQVTFSLTRIHIVNARPEGEVATSSGWGIGLTIMERLCEYFQCELIINDRDPKLYSVGVMMPQLER